MTAPAYTTDLATFLLAESSGESWAEPTATGWAQLGTSIVLGDTDDFIQGVSANSGQCKTGVGGLLANFGTGITIPTDGAVLMWVKFDAGGSLDNETNGGIRTMIGSALNAFYWVSQGGSDTYTYGGWLNVAMADPSAITTTTVGSPTSTRQYAGWAYNALAVPSKGNPYKADAIRYGRAELRVAFGATADGYATFAGMATQNDLNTTGNYNRWGLFSYRDGSYLWKGLMTLGYTNATDFRDANRNIFVQNTKHVTSGFNKIEVRQAGSRVDWTAISITALGTVSKGRFQAVDNATINFDSCTFTDMDTFVFQSASAIVGTTFRRCGLVTAGGASFTGCTFSNSTASASLTAATLANTTGCTFVSDGGNHAVELSSIGAGSMNWDNTLTGYDTGSTGSPVTPTNTGNEAIYVNVGAGTLTINVVAGASTPSIRSAGATVNVVAGQVTVSLKVTNATGTAISGAKVLVLAGAGGGLPSDVTVSSIVNSGTTASVTHSAAHGMLTGDNVLIQGASLAANNGIFSITKTGANTYDYTMGSSPGSSPTGTIKATFVALTGDTDGTGSISMSRSFGSAQPVTGWARKSTSFGTVRQFMGNQSNASATLVVGSTQGWALPRAGTLLIAAVGSTSSVTSVTDDSGSGSWAEAVPSVNTTDSDEVAIWWKIANGGEANITFTAGSSAVLHMEVAEVIGPWVASAVDVTVATSESSTNSKTLGPTSSTTQANDFAAAVVMHRQPTTITKWSDGFVELGQSIGTDSVFGLAVKVLSATGTVSTTVSFGDTANSWGAISTFKLSGTLPGLYKQGPVNGTVDTGAGATLSAVLISDE